MPGESEDTVSAILDRARQGSESAASNLWDRYFLRLAVLAEERLRDIPGSCSGEDVALSALKSVIVGIQRNKYPDLTSDGLWPLLFTIVANKSNSEIRWLMAHKRPRFVADGQDELLKSMLIQTDDKFSLELLDELESLAKSLRDESLKTIVVMKLSGSSNEEVATSMSISKRTVARKLSLIRREWKLKGSSLE